MAFKTAAGLAPLKYLWSAAQIDKTVGFTITLSVASFSEEKKGRKRPGLTNLIFCDHYLEDIKKSAKARSKSVVIFMLYGSPLTSETGFPYFSKSLAASVTEESSPIFS